MGQENSDPLPYTQVDRAVKPKVALLAGALGITIQHAMGSLVEFWDLCGDPRDLERLVKAGVGEIVLSREDIAGRFALASGGKTVDPGLLAHLGLLEPRGDDFRVRGMSRYFQPITRRVQAREAASKGGLATAAKAHRIDGKFAKKPVDEAGPSAGPSPDEALERPLQRSPSDTPSAHQAEHQAAGKRDTEREPTQRSEVSGQRASVEATTLSTSVDDGGPEDEELEPKGTPADAVFEHWRRVLSKAAHAKFKGKRRRRVLERLKDGFSVEDLKRAIDGCARTPHNMGQNDRGEVFDDLELICRDVEHVERFMRNADKPPNPAGTKGRATNADKDWSGPRPKTRMTEYGEELDLG